MKASMNPHEPGIFWRRVLLAIVTGLLVSLITHTSAQAQVQADTPPSSTSYAVLADLLEDKKSRDTLIEQLRTLAAEASASPAGQNTAQHARTLIIPDIPGETISNRLQWFAAEIKHNLSGSWQVISTLLSGKKVPGISLQHWLPALSSLLVAILSVSIAYLILRRFANYGFRRLDAWIVQPHPAETLSDMSAGTSQEAQQRLKPRRTALRTFALTRGRKLTGVILALSIDLAASLLAGLVGYAAIIAFTSQNTDVSLFAMQFLTAFVAIEAIKAVSRGIFATRYEQLRLLPVSAATAQYWNRWFIAIISITGYSLLVLVPAIKMLLTPAVGQLLGLLIMLAVYLYAVRVVWDKHVIVRQGLIKQAEHASTAILGTLLRILARIWHWLALSYLTVLFIVSQTDQQQALAFMVSATFQSVAAILIGTVSTIGVSALLARRIHVPERWRTRLPSLESRINAYVPAFLKSIRLLIIILVSLVVLDAWHVFNLTSWLTSSQGQAAISMVIHVGIILLIAAGSWTVLASIIEHRLGITTGKHGPTEREKTLLMLFRNAAAVTILTLTVLVVLSQIGIDIGPLIAGAGVAGLAIGFGAQKLVQDVITGVFIQLENGMNQNDIVELAGLFGTVEKITIRSVVIRTLDGGYHLIPFSTIDKLTNHTRDYGYHYAEYNIAHRESVEDAIEQLELAFQALMQVPELASEVLEDISIPGVTSINERGFTIRVMIKTTPGNQWFIQRAFNRLVKEYFDAADIELPYPQTVLHFGRDKNGQAKPDAPATST